MLGYGNNVTRAAALGQRGNCGKNQAVIFTVKVVRRNNVADLVPGQFVQHQPANQGLLRFYGVRRYFEALFCAPVKHSIVKRSGHSQISLASIESGPKVTQAGRNKWAGQSTTQRRRLEPLLQRSHRRADARRSGIRQADG